MAKHRAGDRRIMSISIPEDLAKSWTERSAKAVQTAALPPSLA